MASDETNERGTNGRNAGCLERVRESNSEVTQKAKSKATSPQKRLLYKLEFKLKLTLELKLEIKLELRIPKLKPFRYQRIILDSGKVDAYTRHR